ASRELMRIVRDLPIALDLERARLGRYDREAVIRLFREFEFRSLLDRLPPLAGEGAEEARAALRATAEAAFPAARVGARPAGWGPERGGGPERAGGGPARDGAGPTAATALTGGGAEGATRGRPRSLLGEGVGLQLSLDFDAVVGPTAGTKATEGAAAIAPPGAPVTAPAAGAPGPVAGPREPGGRPSIVPASPAELRDRLAAAIADPGRVLEAAPADDELTAWLAAQGVVGVGFVQTDPRPLRGEPLALALAGVDGRVVVATDTAARAAVRRLVEARPAVVGHEVKPLLVAGLVEAPDAPPVPVAFDTQIAAYLLNASLRSQPLADVVAERLDLVLPPAADLPPVARAGLDALAALAVRPPLEAALAAEGLERLFREVELPLIPILARMERIGVAVDRAALAVLDEEFAAEIRRLEAEIYASVGHEFNLGSPKQLEQVLFFELNLPKGRRTKTGYSTDASVLEELRPAHPMIDKLLEWRMYTKLRSTYVQALPALIGPDGRLHTTFHQAVAATGRLSSSDPNLQNIPIRTPLGRRIRRAFVAGDPALTLLAADYSQIELRILAHVSGDEHLREAFARGADVHRETAARVLRKDPAEVTPDERSMAKMVNFGIAYGMSDFGLSSRAGISRAEAQEFINSYFATYSGISYYMLHIKEVARREGVVTTLLGRKRSIPELAARNQALRAAGERMAINMPIQGTAADIMKIAMIRVDERLRAAGLGARMLLQVHDELVFEVPRGEVEATAALVRETMETAVPLDVPLVVEVKVGDDWEGMTPLGRPAGEAELDEDAASAAAGLGEPVA
ncbi:MAG TPA: DNA polymerase I, partial [Candidatus Binatia bacterium]|nr:DNA polymerase I [Candidatus Binatia bacterium]